MEFALLHCFLRALVAVVYLVSITQLQADAKEMKLPVIVYGCTAIPNGTGLGSLVASAVRFSYKNVSSKAITKIQFELRSSNALRYATDNGLRVPQSTSEHDLFLDSGAILARLPFECTASYVRFADGSSIGTIAQVPDTVRTEPSPTPINTNLTTKYGVDSQASFCSIPRIIVCSAALHVRTSIINEWTSNPVFGPEFLVHQRIRIEYGDQASETYTAHFQRYDFKMVVAGTRFDPTSAYEDETVGGVSQREQFGDGVVLTPGQTVDKILTFGPFNKNAYPPSSFQYILNESAPSVIDGPGN